MLVTLSKNDKNKALECIIWQIRRLIKSNELRDLNIAWNFKGIQFFILHLTPTLVEVWNHAQTHNKVNKYMSKGVQMHEYWRDRMKNDQGGCTRPHDPRSHGKKTYAQRNTHSCKTCATR
jgi:hypothetical protein